MNGKPYAVFFFHLIHCNQSTLAQPRERELVLLVPMIWVFEVFPEPPSFTHRSFWLPLYPWAHTTICKIETGMQGKYKLLFSHCWSAKHFLLENESYVFGESEFIVEDSFYKKKLLDIINCLVYVRGVVP